MSTERGQGELVDAVLRHTLMPCSHSTFRNYVAWAQCYGCDWKGPRRASEGVAAMDHRQHFAEVIQAHVDAKVAAAVEDKEIETLRGCTDLYCQADKDLIRGWADTLTRVRRERREQIPTSGGGAV